MIEHGFRGRRSIRDRFHEVHCGHKVTSRLFPMALPQVGHGAEQQRGAFDQSVCRQLGVRQELNRFNVSLLTIRSHTCCHLRPGPLSVIVFPKSNGLFCAPGG